MTETAFSTTVIVTLVGFAALIPVFALAIYLFIVFRKSEGGGEDK